MANEHDFEEIEQNYFKNFRSHMEEVEKNQQPSPCDKETADQQQPPPRPKETVQSAHHSPRLILNIQKDQTGTILQEKAAVPPAVPSAEPTTKYLLEKIKELEEKLKRPPRWQKGERNRGRGRGRGRDRGRDHGADVLYYINITKSILSRYMMIVLKWYLPVRSLRIMRSVQAPARSTLS
ncbi:hypothetical protein PUN28_011863 [Cardiocondyla obscurior]|uniref:Uncharacterized protein n=1 Tax=Cardiocondyla obscurior TaxID=286306 RepID=A0AAW2FI80_9HYME